MNALKHWIQEFHDRFTYFIDLLAQHFIIVALSSFLVLVFGVLIGVFVFYSSKARAFLLPVVNFLYTIPSLALFALFIPLIGVGLKNALLVLVLYGLLPIVHSTYNALKEVREEVIKAAIGLGCNPKKLFFRVRFLLAIPQILVGLRIAVVMLVAMAGIGALIGAGGLGQAIFRGLNTQNTTLLVAGSLIIALFSVLADKFVSVFQHENALQRLFSQNATKKQKRKVYLNVAVFLFLLLASALWLIPRNAIEEKPLVVATKPSSEQYILGEILSLLLEKHHIPIKRAFGIGGGTMNIHPALLRGDFDLYVEYTGTAWVNTLKNPLTQKVDFETIKKRYEKEFNLLWVGLLGFNNTYSLAISKEDAQKYAIETFSDLAFHSPNFDFGAEFDFFEREDAFKGLVKAYRFHFRSLHEMDINLRYKSFESHKINALDVFTTDAQIKELDLKVLKDDKGFFPNYQAGIVMRKEIVKKYPEALKILEKLDSKFSDEVMQDLNYQVEVLKKSPQIVAKEFLESLGL
ncbi:substrate binding domain of ABC-type glycine betaine transport system family protein [Helicobacter pylori CPY1662]|uniref:ergothioneine transport permease/ergothioneine binding protein EgtU n=1 Tax=Helicobacter pylori TaxID=210 RepID=UPI0002C48AE9|nr:ABC transporter permease/substrate-binding protein [Helicobacter pylori]EMR60669.1 substrate binding domain of ABC-type glycine betaine transport system family protein [Helicobacter pylori CPY1662]